jgi:hypothetical protein
MAVLKYMVDFGSMLIVVEGARFPTAPWYPASACHGNQPDCLTETIMQNILHHGV